LRRVAAGSTSFSILNHVVLVIAKSSLLLCVCCFARVTRVLQLTVIQKDFSKYPHVATWLGNMRALPEYDAAHAILQVEARSVYRNQHTCRLSKFLFMCLLPICVFICILVVFTSFSQRVVQKNAERMAATASKL
jgi:hypothetical protein